MKGDLNPLVHSLSGCEKMWAWEFTQFVFYDPIQFETRKDLSLENRPQCERQKG